MANVSSSRIIAAVLAASLSCTSIFGCSGSSPADGGDPAAEGGAGGANSSGSLPPVTSDGTGVNQDLPAGGSGVAVSRSINKMVPLSEQQKIQADLQEAERDPGTRLLYANSTLHAITRWEVYSAANRTFTVLGVLVDSKGANRKVLMRSSIHVNATYTGADGKSHFIAKDPSLPSSFSQQDMYLAIAKDFKNIQNSINVQAVNQLVKSTQAAKSPKDFDPLSESHINFLSQTPGVNTLDSSQYPFSFDPLIYGTGKGLVFWFSNTCTLGGTLLAIGVVILVVTASENVFVLGKAIFYSSFLITPGVLLLIGGCHPLLSAGGDSQGGTPSGNPSPETHGGSSSPSVAMCPNYGAYCGSSLGVPSDQQLYYCTGKGATPTKVHMCQQNCKQEPSNCPDHCGETTSNPGYTSSDGTWCRTNLHDAIK